MGNTTQQQMPMPMPPQQGGAKGGGQPGGPQPGQMPPQGSPGQVPPGVGGAMPGAAAAPAANAGSVPGDMRNMMLSQALRNLQPQQRLSQAPTQAGSVPVQMVNGGQQPGPGMSNAQQGMRPFQGLQR